MKKDDPIDIYIYMSLISIDIYPHLQRERDTRGDT